MPFPSISPYILAIAELNFFVAKFVRGMYDVRVKGWILEAVSAELEQCGIKYKPRDQTGLD